MYYETLYNVVSRIRFYNDRNVDILKLKRIEQRRNLDENIFKKSMNFIHIINLLNVIFMEKQMQLFIHESGIKHGIHIRKPVHRTTQKLYPLINCMNNSVKSLAIIMSLKTT